MYSRLLLTATAVAGLAAFGAAPAHAALEITLAESGFATKTVTSPTSPLSVDNLAFGTFSTTTNSGFAGNAPSIDLASLDASTTTGGTLVITLSEDGLTNPTGLHNWLTLFSGNVFQGSATVSVQSYLGSTLNDLAVPLSSLSGSGFSFGNSGLATVTNPSVPFSLTEVVTITAAPDQNGTAVSLDSSVAAVPEPATLGLLGSAICGIGLVGRRKRNRA